MFDSHTSQRPGRHGITKHQGSTKHLYVGVTQIIPQNGKTQSLRGDRELFGLL